MRLNRQGGRRQMAQPFCPASSPAPQVAGDQDIADLLSALDEGSTAAPGGLYAAALPAAPADEAAGGSGLATGVPAAESEGEAAAAAAADRASSGKVAAVCAAVRGALERRDRVRTLSCHRLLGSRHVVLLRVHWAS